MKEITCEVENTQRRFLVQASVTKETHAELKALAESSGLSLSKFLNLLLTKVLKDGVKIVVAKK